MKIKVEFWGGWRDLEVARAAFIAFKATYTHLITAETAVFDGSRYTLRHGLSALAVPAC